MRGDVEGLVRGRGSECRRRGFLDRRASYWCCGGGGRVKRVAWWNGLSVLFAEERWFPCRADRGRSAGLGIRALYLYHATASTQHELFTASSLL